MCPKCLLIGIDWACPLVDALCSCPLEELILRLRVPNRTPSHIWWRLHPPIFPSSVGLLTQMQTPLLSWPGHDPPSLWCQSSKVWHHVQSGCCAQMGDGSPRCSLHLSPRVLDASPMHSPLHMSSQHWCTQMTPPFLSTGSLILGLTNSCSKALPPLKCVYSIFAVDLLNTLFQSLGVWMTMWPMPGLPLGEPF